MLRFKFHGSVVVYLYETNQLMTLVLENFVAVEQVEVIELVQLTLELERARFQSHSKSFETVTAVLRRIVAL